MTLPKEINAIRVVSYRIDDELIESLVEVNQLSSKEEITLEHLIDYVGEWAVEDLATIYNGIVFQDENGNTLTEWTR